MERYSRQVLFPGIGEAGQARLAGARALLVGCGALGTVLANVLVRAGVGRLTVVDRDYVERSNLQRQVLFDEDDLASDLPKAVAAAEKLRRINPEVVVEPVVADLNATNVETLLAGADVAMDGTDNFEARYLLNDACVKHGVPWVYAAAIGAYGATFPIVPRDTPCLRCVFAENPAPGTLPTCDTAGVRAVTHNESLLRLRLPDYEITVFPDARALIKGTTDPVVARSLYSRYVGL